MSFQHRLKNLRLGSKMTQQDVADKLGITRQAYGYYESENSKREPDHESTQRLASIFNVSVDYLLIGIEYKPCALGQATNFTSEELHLFKELKKHPILLNDLASDPEKKVNELLKMYRMKEIFLEEYGDGIGKLKD